MATGAQRRTAAHRTVEDDDMTIAPPTLTPESVERLIRIARDDAGVPGDELLANRE